MFLIIFIKSLIIGGLVGVGVGPARHGCSTRRPYRAWEPSVPWESSTPVKGTPPPTSRLVWASSSTPGPPPWRGAFTQDVDHRIIPHWATAALLFKNRDLATTLHDPKKMAIAGGIIGAIVVAFLNSTPPYRTALQVTAVKVLVPTANLLVNTVMPVIFWLAAIEAGKKSGFWATIFGGLAQLIMGNAVPGLVLGILIGKGVEESGWNHVTKVMMAAIVLLFVLSGFFRGFDMKLIESFHLGVPLWLENVHNLLSGK